MAKIISKWSVVGLIFGALLFISSWIIRYYLIYQDYSQLAEFCGIAILIMCVSWLYWKNVELTNRLDSVEDWLAEQKEVKDGMSNL